MTIDAQIAQLVEQRTENPRVAGSIPALGISLICYQFHIFVKFDIYFISLSLKPRGRLLPWGFKLG